ncbi:Bromodomain-domain-containing protein [Ascobolus immersus RN42]|uniref:Bromodomain-domain-containing protein n=1 Tax=Ascobolus immersus RN42 TaxID=1160509 RepID=A0A3N4IM52_ASCIM|nr:Bromodomain-domain-containing protein [Ascobolus immersus RN42]
MAIMSPQPASGEPEQVKSAAVDGDAMDIDSKTIEEKKVATEKEEPTKLNTNGNGVNGGSPPLSSPSLSPRSMPTLPTGQNNARQLSELHITSPDAMSSSLSAISPTDTSHMNDVVMKDSPEEKKPKIKTEAPKERPIKKEGKVTPNVKVSRSREEDEHVAPPSKRAKTEESQDGDNSGRNSTSGLTKAQQKYAVSLLRNIKRLKDAIPFLHPVDHKALNIPTYPEIIKHPMDISTMENRLNHHEYATVDEFVADFNLMIENCHTFNGPEHPVAHMGNAIRNVFEKSIKQMPSPEKQEPPTPEKKHSTSATSKKKSAQKKPVSSQTAPGATSSSKKDSSKPSKKKSIPSAPPSQTFAVGPSGIPLIRRESAASDRPKREIHPPPPRDLPYADVKPRRKKVATELKFCDIVLRELLKRQHQSFAFVFYSPVDPIALNIPDYFKIIRKPMDLSTIQTKLKTNEYNSAQEFEQDIRLMLSNCFKFNPPGSVVHGYGKKVEEIFNAKWKEKAAYIQANTSQDSPVSASPAPEEEVMSEEEEPPAEEEASKIKLLEKQLAEMQEQLTMMKKTSKASKAPKEPVSKKSKSNTSSGHRGSVSQPVAAKKPLPTKKPKKEEKPQLRQLTVEEKYELSEKINSLPPNKLRHVTKLIRENMDLTDESDDELELDMDDLPNEVLHKLRTYVNRQVGGEDTSYKPVRPEYTAPSPPPAPAPVAAAPQTVRPKKNKPMSAVEQEAKIATLQAKLNSFKGGNSVGAAGGGSTNSVVTDWLHSLTPTGFAQTNDDSSDDEDSGSSEEE